MQYLSVLTNFAIILMRKRELVTYFYLSSGCLVTVIVALPHYAVGVIVVFADHTHLLLAETVTRRPI